MQPSTSVSPRRRLSRTRVLLSFLVLSAGIVPAFAQDDNHDWDDWDSWKDFTFTYRRSPTASLYYGWTTTTHDGFGGTIAPSGYLQVKIGGSRVRMEEASAKIVNYKYEYFDLARYAPRLTGSPPAGEVNKETWRFGGVWESGFGYGTPSSFSLLLYNGGGMNWSEVTYPDQQLLPGDSAILDLYRDTFRFGTLTEGGLKVRLTDLVMIDGAYERSLIFPRHLFMKWVGSALLEVVAQGGVDWFVNRVMESSPGAAPVVNFVLKNGVSYAFYELRKTKMTWPFSSDPAMLNDTFKVGLTLTF